MRGLLLRALPVCLVALASGCFTTSSERAPTVPRSATHAYWQQAGAVLARKPAGDDMGSMVKLVEYQTDALHDLSPEGVDPALVAAVGEVIKCEDEVLRVGATFNFSPAELKINQPMAVVFADANRKAAESKKKLKAMRGELNARHGGGFGG